VAPRLLYDDAVLWRRYVEALFQESLDLACARLDQEAFSFPGATRRRPGPSAMRCGPSPLASRTGCAILRKGSTGASTSAPGTGATRAPHAPPMAARSATFPTPTSPNARPPAGAARADWEIFVREVLPPVFVRLDGRPATAADVAFAPLDRLSVATPEVEFRAWLRERFGGDLDAARAALGIGVAEWAGIRAPIAADVHERFLAALILPGMANGHPIFLLKGIFDSLPRELYESAELEGTGEWTMFWTLTMSLSRPILAVVALQAFTAAYSNFMYALLICQGRRMWTLMVWLYELQNRGGTGVVHASLLIAAVPTLLVFLLCQRVILRGIVIPVER